MPNTNYMDKLKVVDGNLHMRGRVDRHYVVIRPEQFDSIRVMMENAEHIGVGVVG